MADLTETRLRALKPKTARYEVGDRDGLLIEVHPSGRMTWRFRYRLDGRREKVTLGSYPATGLKAARDRAREAQRLVEAGQSPARMARLQAARAKTEADTIETVGELAERWVAEVLIPANKHAGQDETYLRRDLLPRLRRLRPDDVTTVDVRACVDAVLKRGHGQAARRVRSVAKRLFDFAASLGLVRWNPASVIRPTDIAPTTSRKRTLSDDELRAWVRCLETSRLNRSHVAALRLLLLVPARKGELIAARWADFDLDAGTWDIPVANSKNGAPIRHKLPRQAIELLRGLQEMAGGAEWVLPSTQGYGKRHITKTTINTALATVRDKPEGACIHDLRRTVRTGLSDLGGIPAEVAELCLNHRPKGVAGVYDRAERIEERAQALQRWADHVDAVLASGGNVVPFRQKVVV